MEDSSLSTFDIIKSVNVLAAIRWIKLAWENVQLKTIVNCFKHCRAVPDVSTNEEDEDPFAGLEQDVSLVNLLVKFKVKSLSINLFLLTMFSAPALLLMIQIGGEKSYKMRLAVMSIYP